ncbi:MULTISPECIES: superinfection immunity protein [Burkholderia]|uniref:Superinfection immunity protein n=2 Tax=Burkholderia humptydooensis TaxID=430531 RepID=A0A7U4PAS8_9BURK|nr:MULTISPECIES: superinfection immunity protein [Burkholderia]AGK50470.1 superinfection immunity family protein [Burkholderia thailandensis MSMB121]ATF33107.1 superinfection immunity protein [Burkholderia thailandensis]AJY38346.1 superinfection immunity family protein [Burkholderia sp. 2002721687]ALX46125.1 immunity protein [Burkholderia humptydooensis]EIP87153.1 putative immunity protein [Burkholderia humptydooensis MSMB43]
MQMEILIQVVGSVVAIALYFLPATVADRRHRHDRLTVALFNALFGWTGIGWLLTLYWALQPDAPADFVSDVRLKRRAVSMKTFSTGLVERVQRRIAAQEQWAEKQGTR